MRIVLKWRLLDYWIDRNEEIRTPWEKEEKEFVTQFQDDEAIRDVFGVAIMRYFGFWGISETILGLN
jgi:hypothetical protein